MGSAHAAVIRFAVVLVGGLATLVITLQLFDIAVTQLVVGGAVTGVLLGIAAQQSLANVFAGIVLLFARPFRVGDPGRQVRRTVGLLEGTVATSASRTSAWRPRTARSSCPTLRCWRRPWARPGVPPPGRRAG